MNEKDLELKLLTGVPIYIDSVGYLNPPKLEEVIQIGESVYNQIVAHLLIDKSNIESLTSEATNFQAALVLYHYNDMFRKLFSYGIELYFKEKLNYSEDGFFYFGSISDNRIIDQEAFDVIQRCVIAANKIKIKQEEEFNPANEQAKRIIDMILKGRKEKPKSKETVDLHSMISGLAWKSNNLSILDITKLTIYQLYDGLNRLDNIEHYQNIMTGIYSGTVDSKKINFNDIHWRKIIENK